MGMKEQVAGILEDCKPCNSRSAYASSSRQCTEAPAGRVPNATGTGYKMCPTGYYRPYIPNTNCTRCPAGSYMDYEGGAACIACSPGTYQEALGRTMCLACPNGAVSTRAGATTCTYCSSTYPSGGYVMNMARIACEPCATQQWHESGTTYCTFCAGIPSTKAAATSCAPCAGLQMEFSLKTQQCETCAPGLVWAGTGCEWCRSHYEGKSGLYFNPRSNQTECSQCPLGKKATENQSACEPCPAGWGGVPFTYGVCPECTQKDGVCKKCAAGEFSENGLCLRCKKGTFNPMTGQSSCMACMPGRYSTAIGVSECRLCPKGTFSNVTGNTACVACDASKFAAMEGMPACETRGRYDCGEGNVKRRMYDATKDDECKACPVCRPNQYYFTKATEGMQLVTTETQSIMARCDGMSYEPAPYECVNNQPRKGMQFKAGALIPCAPLPSTVYMDFVAGREMTQCYVGCRYAFCVFVVAFALFV